MLEDKQTSISSGGMSVVSQDRSFMDQAQIGSSTMAPEGVTVHAKYEVGVLDDN